MMGPLVRCILVCGSRTWTDPEPIKRELGHYAGDLLVIHGGAKGADTLADIEAHCLGFRVKIFEAEWGRHGLKAGPIRNKQMVLRGKPDRVLAFTTDLEKSKGTRDMVFQAVKAGIPVRIYSK